MPRFRLYLRIILLPAVLVLFFLVFYLIYEDIKNQTIQEFNNEQLILARTASQGMTSFFEELQSNLTFLSEFKDIIEFSVAGEELLEKFYNAHINTIAAVTRVNPEGIIMHTFPLDESVIGKDISYQAHVNQVISSEKMVISDVFQAEQGYLTIAVHIPIFKDGIYSGSLAILIPIDKLGELYLGNINTRGTGNVWLLSENGIEIYCPFVGHIGTSMIENMHNNDAAVELFEKIKLQSNGTVRGIHFNVEYLNAAKTNRQYITFYKAPLGNTYWTILISYQEKDIYAAIARLRNRLILIFILLFATVTYFIYSLARARRLLREEENRKEAEKILLKSEEKFRRLFEDHMAVKFLIDPENGAIVDANKSASKYYGWTREELKGMNISDINTLPPDKVQINMDSVESQKKVQFEFKHRLKNGSIRDVEVLTSLVEIDEKSYLHSIIYDITFRKEVEAALIKSKEKAEESDELKTAFLQNMSHEIRTPMNAIMGFSSLLVDCYNNKPLLEKYSRIISHRGRDLLEIIEDILNISKIESGQLTINNEKIDLEEFFDDLGAYIYGYQNRFDKNHIEISLQAPVDVAISVIVADKTKIRQILINLLSNALKYTNSGNIQGGCRFDKDQKLIFYVFDTGIGIPLDKQELIFERFSQINQRNGVSLGGTGLGLSIAKGLVELMGGEIWLESEPGRGSKFYFTIPVEITADSTPAQATAKKETTTEFSDKTILLVEDDISGRKLIEEFLVNTGLTILHTEYGKEAVHLAIERSPDLILMDIGLPDINGYEATRLIKEQKPGFCIIALTAFAAEGDRQKALEAGCTDYISKPVNKELLLDMIIKYIRK